MLGLHQSSIQTPLCSFIPKQHVAQLTTQTRSTLCPAGLISAAPGKKNGALQEAARQVEAMVIQKMSQPEYIIMCLEDSSDWNNATTRRIVMQVGSISQSGRQAACRPVGQ